MLLVVRTSGATVVVYQTWASRIGCLFSALWDIMSLVPGCCFVNLFDPAPVIYVAFMPMERRRCPGISYEAQVQIA